MFERVLGLNSIMMKSGSWSIGNFSLMSWAWWSKIEVGVDQNRLL